MSIKSKLRFAIKTRKKIAKLKKRKERKMIVYQQHMKMPCWRVSLLERNRFTGAKWDVVGRNPTTFPIAFNGSAKQSCLLISIPSNHPIHNIKKCWKRFYYRLSKRADDKFIFLAKSHSSRKEECWWKIWNESRFILKRIPDYLVKF